jgi:hypothetical protein
VLRALRCSLSLFALCQTIDPIYYTDMLTKIGRNLTDSVRILHVLHVRRVPHACTCHNLCYKLCHNQRKNGQPLFQYSGGWRGSWHCLSGEHLLCILFSRPESRKTARAGRFESCGCLPIMFKITAWPVGRWICEWRRQPRKRLRLDLGLSLGPDSSRAALVIVADGIVLGSDYGQ